MPVRGPLSILTVCWPCAETLVIIKELRPVRRTGSEYLARRLIGAAATRESTQLCRRVALGSLETFGVAQFLTMRLLSAKPFPNTLASRSFTHHAKRANH